ncbi:hypothetical protein CHUAL_013775 [Chamberlinius hualienensis]
MAWSSKLAALHCLMLLVITTSCLTARKRHSDQEVESAADLLPGVKRILQRDQGAVACFLLQNPPERCFNVLESRNKKRAEKDREWEKSEEETQEDCPPGQNCPSLGLLGERRLVDSSVGDADELRIGPKRFYNNW